MAALPRLRDQPGYGRFWTASAISDFGTPVSTLALSVLVVSDLQASATQLGLVNAARWVPYLAFGLLAGVLIDRARRRFRILVGCDLARALLLGTIPVLYGLDRLNLASVAVVVAMFGAVSVLSDAGHQSALPRLVDRRVLTSANARLEQAGAVARTSGPLLGGVLVRVLGAPFALLVDALSFLASGVLLATIRVAEPDPPDRQQRHLGRELGEGLAWVYRHPMLAPMAFWGHVWFVFNAMLGTIFVPYALRDLRLSALGLGVAYACAGVGAVIGGALARGVAVRIGLGRAVILAEWLTPLGFALIALARPGDLAVDPGRRGSGPVRRGHRDEQPQQPWLPAGDHPRCVAGPDERHHPVPQLGHDRRRSTTGRAAGRSARVPARPVDRGRRVRGGLGRPAALAVPTGHRARP